MFILQYKITIIIYKVNIVFVIIDQMWYDVDMCKER